MSAISSSDSTWAQKFAGSPGPSRRPDGWGAGRQAKFVRLRRLVLDMDGPEFREFLRHVVIIPITLRSRVVPIAEV